MYRQTVISSHRLLGMLVVFGILQGIYAIGKDIGCM